MTKKRDQEKEKQDFEDQQNELELERTEMEEEFEREEKDWPEFKYAAFKTKKVQFVVCLNTLGQDRCFTEKEVSFAIETVKKYRDTWEKLEKKNLEHDVNLSLKYTEYDMLYVDHYSARDEERFEEFI